MSIINSMEASELRNEMTDDARKLRKLIKIAEDIEDPIVYVKE